MSADTPLCQDGQPEMLNISDEEDLNPGISYIQLDEEGREISNPTEDEKIAQMTDEELRREYEKLPPAQNENITSTSSSITSCRRKQTQMHHFMLICENQSPPCNQ